MAWKYSALQDKVSSIQNQLLIRMEQKSDCSDRLIPMIVTSNDVQDSQDSKGISHKRKAEDYLPMDNSKISRPCLMLDMYTQTDRTMSNEISLQQVYDLVQRNSERLHKMEDILTKLHDALESNTDNLTSPGSRSHPQVAMSLANKKQSTSSPVLSQVQSPTSVTRPQFIGTHYQGQGLPVSNNSFPSVDYVTQSNEIGDWDGGRNDIASTVSAAPSAPENRMVDVNPASGKTPTKEEWNCENSSLSGSDQPSGPGCWLGDANDANRRAWFSGDPKIIERCESYGVNPVKLALSLTEALFTRDEMAASNVRGTRGKETLDPSKIRAIRAHVDYKYPIEEDRMEVRWQLIKPKLDSKCRSQRRLQREHKWKFERMSEKAPTSSNSKPKRPVLDVEEREMLLYGSPKTVLNPVVSVYTESTTDTTSFSEGQGGYLPNPGE